MGLLLYRLLLVNAVVINALDVLVAGVRRLCKWPGQHDAAMVHGCRNMATPLVPLHR